MRVLSDRELVVASHNLGKVREIKALLAPHNVRVSSAAKFNLAEPNDTGTSFSANAKIKATAACDTTGLAAIADDSGLVVPALNGAPGVYSARWAGPHKDFNAAMTRLERELGSRDRAAHFVCALAIAWPGGGCQIFQGKAFGTLVFPPRGENGFGYDPIFQPKETNQTYGEMQPEEKHLISHRASAFAKLSRKYFNSGSEDADDLIKR